MFRRASCTATAQRFAPSPAGAGSFEYTFARYEQAPADVQEKEIEARAEEAAK
jgi:hypothetical protein